VRSRLKQHSTRSRSGSRLGEGGETLQIGEIELGPGKSSSGRSSSGRSSSGVSVGAALMRQRPLRARVQEEIKPEAKVVYSVTQLIGKAMFDRHSGGDGRIDAAELRYLMRELAHDLSDEEHSVVMAKLDADGDGTVSFGEFCAWWDVGLSMEKLLDPSFGKQLGQQRAEALFRRHAGSDEQIDATELAGLCAELGHVLSEEQAQLAMAKLDLDCDGTVCLDVTVVRVE
jgi:Ca2+-binding EF-hand superfamily protein